MRNYLLPAKLTNLEFHVKDTLSYCLLKYKCNVSGEYFARSVKALNTSGRNLSKENNHVCV